MKDILLAGPFAISKNCLGRGGTISPPQERFFKMSKYRNRKCKKYIYNTETFRQFPKFHYVEMFQWLQLGTRARTTSSKTLACPQPRWAPSKMNKLIPDIFKWIYLPEIYAFLAVASQAPNIMSCTYSVPHLSTFIENLQCATTTGLVVVKKSPNWKYEPSTGCVLCASAHSPGLTQLLGPLPLASLQLFLQLSAPRLSSTRSTLFHCLRPRSRICATSHDLLTCTWVQHHATG